MNGKSNNNKNKSAVQITPTSKHSSIKPSNKPIRIYIDGCWDLMHSGHYNALRQAKALGNTLVVGIHSDEEISKNKREPVMNNEQRIATVKACKWADEVVFDVPYAPTLQLLEQLNCDYVAHGDDIAITNDGTYAYKNVEDKLKIFRRTHGVSTTHLIQRLLDAVKYNGSTTSSNNKSTSSWSSFLASSSRISAFSNNRMPTKHDKVVYIDGSFDLFNIGHIAALKKAKELGTFLLVGVYDDNIIRRRKGDFFPLMNVQERVLNVLSCKYVDDVIIGAPWKLTKQILKTLHISYVVVTKNTLFSPHELDRYNVAKKVGIYRELNIDINYTTEMLMERIIDQESKFESENRKSIQKAKQYGDQYVFVPESSQKAKQKKK